ncbi:MAG: hypothetical protein DSM106950_35220 [Stigonema ocellatum SAG 48.90 = DSM 106950]|nr:hypothetical protein [Stigonema ocellatum SAG 48.90 = DSM 106950]
MVSDLKQRFGNSPAYEKVKKFLVRYINNVDGSQGLLPLEQFRRKVPQPPDMSNVEVRGIAPDDTATLSGVEYIELGVDQEPLLQRVIKIIDESLGME